MQDPSVIVSLNDTGAVPQASVAVNVSAVGTASHSTVISIGKVSTNVGATVS